MEEKINAMTEGGKKLGIILQSLLDLSKPGTNLLEIEREAQDQIQKAGGMPSFTTVSGYKWATCLCINDEIVHGIPKNYILVNGDVLTIDIGILYKGFHTDTAWTKIVGHDNSINMSEKQIFLDIGKNALRKAIDVAIVGNRVGHISNVIEEEIMKAGYSIIRSLVGHGVGKKLHEEPQIPGFLNSDINKTPLLYDGMTIAIEVIYAKGKGLAYVNPDGWTMCTRDESLSAVFEHTIQIRSKRSYVLTGW